MSSYKIECNPEGLLRSYNCWTQSRIGDRHRSNSSKCPCLYPFLLFPLSQLIVVDIKKRHEHYTFSPPKHSSNCEGYHVNFRVLFLRHAHSTLDSHHK
uniref:Uncharacterized protein n=1 Tax=Lepeophtheirus salmonis TaxID=72036 RepID=A0A0K2V9J7_LEPSM